jgi:hypothetical protein
MTGIVQGLLAAYSAVSSAVSDAYFNLVTLLLPGNGTNGAQNNTFLDSSSNNFTITRNGNTTQGTFSPFSQTGWSNYFGGSADALTVPSTSALTFGTGDFCVEFWLYRTTSATAYGLFSNSTGAGGGDTQFEIQLNVSAYIALLGWNTIFMTGATAIPQNTWNHVAVVRSGTSMAIFVNGVRDATATSANNFSSTNGFNIARQATGSGYFPGYLSNLRAVKGASVYSPSSTTITVPTAPLTNITNTSLLTCQSNRFVDNSTANSGSGFTITTVTTPSVQAFEPFAPGTEYSAATVGGSGYFDGSGDTLAPPNNAAFAMSNGAFTIEFWFYTSSISQTGYILQTDVNSTALYVSFASSTLRLTDQNTTYVSTPTLVANQWYHIAVVRSGTGTNQTVIYTNGVAGTAGTCTQTFTQAGPVIGGNGYLGYISNFRMVKGTAVYSSNFTPPTAPVTAITNTQLLLDFTNAGITDATAKNDLETVGNAQISTAQSKFGGSSMLFDGTGDYLVPIGTNTPQFTFPGDFTIELWIYVTNISSYSFIFDGRASGVTSGAWLVDLNGAVIGWGPGSSIAISSSSILANTWYHLAICRSGSSTRMFLDGTQTGSTYTDSGSYTVGTNRPIIGGSGNSPGSFNFPGYIDDLRITKGAARYTANFTAPTSAFPLQ